MKKLTSATFLLICIFFGLTALAQPLPGPDHNRQLNQWTFSDTNWLSQAGYSPENFTNIFNEPDGNGNCLWLDSTNAIPAFLFYNVVETNGFTNIICTNGSISLWFSPDWSSTNQGGSGPGDWANLISLGQAGTNGSSWWAWYFSPDGCTVYFSSQTNGGTFSNYLAAPVSLSAYGWYNLVLTYSLTNSAFYTNGVLVTNGTGVAYWPGLEAPIFAVGSDTNGFYQGEAEFDDLQTYNYPMDSNSVAGWFEANEIFYGPVTSSNSGQAVVEAPAANATLPTVDFVTGPGFLQTNGNSPSTSTGSNVSIFNCSVALTSSNVMKIKFAVSNGFNGLPYDVFATTALKSPFTNTVWYWMGQAYRGTNYILSITNYPLGNVFLILGLPGVQSDGLTAAFERLVIKNFSTNYTGHTYGAMPDAWIAINGLEGSTNILTLDPDMDGLSNWQEYLYGTKPLVSEGFNIWVSNPGSFSAIP